MKTLTDADLDDMATLEEYGYDVNLCRRWVGRPTHLGSGQPLTLWR